MVRKCILKKKTLIHFDILTLVVSGHIKWYVKG
jgi:hypothetical protein